MRWGGKKKKTEHCPVREQREREKGEETTLHQSRGGGAVHAPGISEGKIEGRGFIILLKGAGRRKE